jgi:hypothetical protein
MIWANLLHLGYNMWEDHEVAEPPMIHNRSFRPYLRCDRSLWNDLTNQMAAAGMNMLIVDLGEGVVYDSHPELAVEGSWTPDELRTELARLRSIGIEPIPKMNFSTAHDAWLGDYGRMVSTKSYYEVVTDLIAEGIALFDGPRFFHLGMDEETPQHQRYSEYAVIRQHDLWWRDLYFMIEQVEKAGARSWIWSDYMWHHEEDFLRKMPRSVLQSNWYYGEEFHHFENSTPGSAETRVKAYVTLEEHGYDQVPTGSNWSSPVNFERTVEFCQSTIAPERLLGFMTAPWHATLEERREHHEAAIKQVQQAMITSSGNMV